MSWLLDLRLIPFFGFYLAVFFLIGTVVRLRQYRAIVGLVRSMPARWPRLLRLLGQHYNILVTWGTFMPLLIVLALYLANYLASTHLWPHAETFTVARLA